MDFQHVVAIPTCMQLQFATFSAQLAFGSSEHVCVGGSHSASAWGRGEFCMRFTAFYSPVEDEFGSCGVEEECCGIEE